MLSKVLLRRQRAFPKLDDRVHALAPLVVGKSNHDGIGNGRMLCQSRFDLGRIDIDPPTDNEVRSPVGQVQRSLFVEPPQVSDRVEAVGSRGSSRRTFIDCVFVVAATKSVTAQMLLLRALAQPPSQTEIEVLVKGVTQTITGTERFNPIGGKPPGSVVCGGFAADWIADEIALKFAEMAGLPLISESIVEYFHGPAGAATPTLAFLDPQDPNAAGLVGAEGVTTVGPSDSFDVETPGLHEPSLDAFVRLVAGQQIAVEWARTLGENPDSDRGLSKVTRTR